MIAAAVGDWHGRGRDAFKDEGASAAPAGRPTEAAGAGEWGPLGANEAEMPRRTRSPGGGRRGETATKRSCEFEFLLLFCWLLIFFS